MKFAVFFLVWVQLQKICQLSARIAAKVCYLASQHVTFVHEVQAIAIQAHLWSVICATFISTEWQCLRMKMMVSLFRAILLKMWWSIRETCLRKQLIASIKVLSLYWSNKGRRKSWIDEVRKKIPAKCQSSEVIWRCFPGEILTSPPSTHCKQTKVSRPNMQTTGKMTRLFTAQKWQFRNC